jgi:hypothetical protein
VAVISVLWRVPNHHNHAHIRCATSMECIPLGRKLQSMNFRVGEHEAFGGVTIQHSATGGHHDDPSTAIDVNFGPGGENDIEKRAFDALIPSVIYRGLDVYEFAKDIKQPGGVGEEDTLTEDLQRHLDGIEARISQRILDARADLRGHVDVHAIGIEEKRVGGINRLAQKLDAIRATVDAIEPNRVKGVDRIADKLDDIREQLETLGKWDVTTEAPGK